MASQGVRLPSSGLQSAPAALPAARRGAPARRCCAPPAAAANPATGAEEVAIRRRPPSAHPETLGVGDSFDFLMESLDEQGKRVDNPENRPRNILEEIVWFKDVEVSRWKQQMPLPLLVAAAAAAPPPRGFEAALRASLAAQGLPALIAEVKKASPSKGVIQPDFDAVRIAQAYERGGAACLSVLTDAKFFQGAFENLRAIREAGVACPLLCKEFIVEPYQLYKARAFGADAVLLIAAVLPSADLRYLGAIAHKLGLGILIEVHTEEELGRVVALGSAFPYMLGVNNRDLGSFVVDLATTARLLATPPGKEALQRGTLLVGESGVFTLADVQQLAGVGVGAVLVGESLVKQNDPEQGVKALYGRV